MKNVFEFNMIILFEIEDKYNEDKVFTFLKGFRDRNRDSKNKKFVIEKKLSGNSNISDDIFFFS